MAERKVTDLTTKAAASLQQTDVHYMVDTTDTGVDPAGTSYKTTLGDMIEGIKAIDGGIAGGIATLNTSGKLVAIQVPASDKVSYTSPANTTPHLNVEVALNQAIKYVATSGQVKINSYNGGSLDKPTLTLATTAANTFSGYSNLEYGANLNFSSSTEFPIMDPNKNDASIWDNVNKKFRENNSVYQNHIWRIVLNYSRTSFEKVQLLIRLYNQDTSFEVVESKYFSEERNGNPDIGTYSFQLHTVADTNSLSANRGYFLQLGIYGDNNASIDFTLESVTRVSLANSNENVI